jgi:hypothetical protein
VPADHTVQVTQIRSRHDIAHVLRTWRGRPVAIAALGIATFGITGIVVAVGGPPTATTSAVHAPSASATTTADAGRARHRARTSAIWGRG